MTYAARHSCPRLFEAEALRDGRLSGPEVARYEAHLTVCTTCAREVRTLESLANALRSVESSVGSTAPPPTDELHVRRERTRLLAAFDARLANAPLGPPRRPALKTMAFVALAALCAAGVVSRVVPRFAHVEPIAVAGSTKPDAPDASVAPASGASAASQAPTPAVQVDARSDTRWSRRVDAELETITLESGALTVRVEHRSGESARRLLVLLPDGELEDIGTTFSVGAAAGRTTQVSVQSGKVVLRIHGKPSLALGPGDAWSSVPVPSPSAVESAPVSRSASASASPRRPASPAVPDAFADFRLAMSLFKGGNNERAAAHFATFLVEHPRDARAEDAAYLRVLALQRAGNSSAVKQAASEYLNRYPRGFRRAEVEPLAR